MVWIRGVEEGKFGILALVFADFVFELGWVCGTGDELSRTVNHSWIIRIRICICMVHEDTSEYTNGLLQQGGVSDERCGNRVSTPRVESHH